MKQVGARLVMKNRSPGRDRTLQVLIDDVRHTTMYSELLIASTEPRRSESDHVVAFFDAHGFVRGFRTHHAGELPPGPLVALDTAALRAKAASEARKMIPVPLDSVDQRRAKAVAEWLRRRCTG
jgi:hypothetical protein